MSSVRSTSLLLATLMLLAMGCARQPVKNVVDAPVPKPGLTDAQIVRAITQAGSGLGWVMKEDGPGKMTGSLQLRAHFAVVDIAYTPKSYNITYKDSNNLRYDAETQWIHKNYNGWIQNLNNAIRVQLNSI